MAKHENKPVEEQTTALATQQQGGEVMVYDFGDDAGAGMENVGFDEQKIPFLRILDPKSPQCKPVSAGGLPGAKGGAILNSGTNIVFDGEKGFDFIPCYREQKYIRYIQKEEDGRGGGFVAVLEPDDPLVVAHRAVYGKFGKMVVLSDEELAKKVRDPKYDAVPLLDEKHKAHELVQTFALYGIARFDDTVFRAIVSFASTQIPKYQGFVTRYESIRYNTKNGPVKPPIFAHWLHLSTQYESKGAFNWYGWNVRFRELNTDGSDNQVKSLIPMSDPFYAQAKDFWQMITSGEAKVDYSTTSSAAAEDHIPDEDEIPL
jgi:hypothetical protein